MADSEKINLAQLKERYKKGLRIPEIQRDYVMGSGQDKLAKLLDAILEKCKAKEDFDFSSIIAYCKNDDCENAFLDIYDGQQRLTTLLLLVLYKLRQEGSASYRDYKNWYNFSCRPIANKILGILTEENRMDAKALIERMEVQDFTSFSMKKLLEKICEKKYDRITSDYLLNHVKFDKVEMGSQNEIEQFFMDLNSGVKLKEYELYKAKLIHHIGEVKQKCCDGDRKEILKSWAYKLDNEWLDAFKPFASFSHPAEEYEIAFIRYCFRMLSKVRGISENRDGIDHLDGDLLDDTYHMMESVSRLHFADNKCEDNICDKLLYFSWGNAKDEAGKDENAPRRHNYDRRGVAYRLEFEEYEKLLYWVIRNVLLDSKSKAEMCSDVVLWCYLSTLAWQKEKLQKEYLRLVKILLNNNIAENREAWYECQRKGQYMYYCGTIVCGIPQYYGKHKEEIGTKKEIIDNIVFLNVNIIKNGNVDKLSDRKTITFYLMNLLLASEKEQIRNIISGRKSYLESYHGEYSEYLSLEEKCLGIGNPEEGRKYLDNPYWRYFLDKVYLNWPTRGQNNSPEECWITRRCDIDLICCQFSHYNQDDQNCVCAVMKSKFYEYSKSLDGNEARKKACEDIYKCFWKDDKQDAYIIRNRQSDSTTTYIANGSTEQDVECFELFCDEIVR